jgi:hypothetical protein
MVAAVAAQYSVGGQALDVSAEAFCALFHKHYLEYEILLTV